MEHQGSSSAKDKSMLTGLFSDRENTESAYQSLRNRGYTDEEITVLMSDDTRDKYYSDSSELGTKAAEGTAVGGAIGGTLGAVLGGVAAIGTNLVLPGLGLVVWGPLAAAFAGAGAGGLTGGMVGGLVGYGMPEERAKLYESGIQEGGTVLGVSPRNDEDADYFENEWRDSYSGRHIYR